MPKLSAVRKVPETIMFQALGIIETLGSIISLGTSKKFADVRTHLRKVFNMTCLQSETIEFSLSICFFPNERDTKNPLTRGEMDCFFINGSTRN